MATQCDGAGASTAWPAEGQAEPLRTELLELRVEGVDLSGGAGAGAGAGVSADAGAGAGAGAGAAFAVDSVVLSVERGVLEDTEGPPAYMAAQRQRLLAVEAINEALRCVQRPALCGAHS